MRLKARKNEPHELIQLEHDQIPNRRRDDDWLAPMNRTVPLHLAATIAIRQMVEPSSLGASDLSLLGRNMRARRELEPAHQLTFEHDPAQRVTRTHEVQVMMRARRHQRQHRRSAPSSWPAWRR